MLQRPELNGKAGTIVGWRPPAQGEGEDPGRYKVRLGVNPIVTLATTTKSYSIGY